jgi:Family of unknown function (DUF6544)
MGGVRLHQRGEMWRLPGGRPLRFVAVQHIDAGRVAFRWRARFGAGRLRPLVVTDAYEDGAGRLEGRVAGVRLFRATGPDVDRGQVMRYLAELAWLPDAGRANPEVARSDLGPTSAEVSAAVADGRASVRLGLRGGDVVSASAPDRPREDGGRAVPTPWRGSFSDHGDLGGIRVPRRAEAAWELPEGPFTYWRAEVTDLEVIRG